MAWQSAVSSQGQYSSSSEMGRVLSDGGRPQQGPRFAVAPGFAEVRGGKLTFPNTQQGIGVPKPKKDQ
jgi:hypothetical protein